jgi:hypothetical protein
MTVKAVLDIFANNIVTVAGEPQPDITGQDDYMMFVKKDGCDAMIRQSGGRSRTCDVYRLTQTAATNSGNPLCAKTWICPYQVNAIKYQTLNNSRIFCFTTNMNGCTFGIGGSQGTDGTLTVSHANKAETGEIVSWSAQIEEQRTMHAGAAHFDPYHYSAGGFERQGVAVKYYTTTFGVYENNSWSFYYQTSYGSGFNWRLLEFRKIDVNNLRT